MPVYVFHCTECEQKTEVVRSADQRNGPCQCEHCGSDSCVRDFAGEHVASTEQEYQTPVCSDAMGLHPDEIPAFKRRNPDINVNSEGQIVLRSHAERQRVMKRLGFFDRDGYN